MPTASAVVADILDVAKSSENKGYFWEEGKDLIPYAKIKNSYFVRIDKKDEEKAEKLFGKDGFISIGGFSEEFAVITPLMENGTFEEMFKDINVIKKIRIAGEDE